MASRMSLRQETSSKIMPTQRSSEKLTEEELGHSRARNYSDVEIEAIFVFADSRDWAGDQQIILDLCMSKNGRLGTRSETFDGGPPVIFLPQRRNLGYVRNRQYLMLRTLLDGMRHGPCSNHNFSRIGMGALRASFEAMFKAITGKE